jgi:hypothetical protein
MTYVVRDEDGRVLATALEEHEAMAMARRVAKRRVEILSVVKDGEEIARFEPRCQLYRPATGEILFTGPLSRCRAFTEVWAFGARDSDRLALRVAG